MSDPGMRAMPLRFWKKEKPETGKEEKADEKKEPEEKKPMPAVREEKVKPAEPEVKKAEAKKAEAKKPEAQKPETKAPPRPPQPGEVEAAVNEAHAAIVETGLTVPQTRTVFAKRVASYPGGEAAFLELETWADDYAFLIVREPRWDKIAKNAFVIVKADQTANGGECGECGAPVGKYWSDCLKCGAVFG